MAETEKTMLSPSQLRKKKKRVIIIVVAAILLAVAVATTVVLMTRKGEDEKEKEIITTKPFYNTIELTVSGSGTVEPLDRYEIVSLVSGDIISSPFEEGDMVEEDDLVYVIDHEEQNKSIESAKNSITKAKIRNKIYLDEKEYNKTLEKYTVRAEEDGIISGFDLEVGDNVSANAKLGTIQNFDEIVATVPFNAAQFEKIKLGDEATVYLYPSMYRCFGKVTYKSYKTTGSVGGAIVYDVEITFDGSNLTLTDTSVSATVHTDAGDVESPASGTAAYNEAVYIIAEVSGEVLSIPANIKDGAKVNKGDILFKLDTSDFLEQKLLAEMDFHDLELNLENAEDRLENYNIKSPISGTVITKNSKKGDTISGGNNNSALMVIADMSAMKFTFQADETDIDKIEVDQEVKVTADAVENKIFTGIVNSVATEGVSSNGVSYYAVEVIIDNYGQNDETGTLRSGMNVSAEIVYEKAENALCVPVSAVTTIGKESYVFVKGTASEDKKEDATGEQPEEAKSKPGNVGEERSPEMPKDLPNGIPAKTDKSANNENAGKNTDRSEAMKERLAKLVPEGFAAVKVETGVSNGVNIEIISGISENDEIYLAESNNVKTPVSSGSMAGLTGGGMGGFGGGMPGGGMGSFGGGMPGGNMGGMRR